MDLQLKSQPAFVSGSTQGIGFAIARQLLLKGARVILNGRTREKIDGAIRKLEAEIPAAPVSGIAADFADAGGNANFWECSQRHLLVKLLCALYFTAFNWYQ